MFIPAIVTGQISDSLFKALPDSLKPKGKGKNINYLEICKIIENTPREFTNQYYDEFNSLNKELEAEFKTNNSPEAKMICAASICTFYGRIQTNKVEEKWNDQVIANGELVKRNSKILAVAYLNKAVFQSRHDRFTSAIEFLHKATEMAKMEGYKDVTADGYGILWRIHNDLQLNHEALNYANKLVGSLGDIPQNSITRYHAYIAKSFSYSKLYKTEKKRLTPILQ